MDWLFGIDLTYLPLYVIGGGILLYIAYIIEEYIYKLEKDKKKKLVVK